MKISLLGPQYSFSDEAANATILPKDAQLIYANTFEEIGNQLLRRETDIGVFPVLNRNQGVVRPQGKTNYSRVNQLHQTRPELQVLGIYKLRILFFLGVNPQNENPSLDKNSVVTFDPAYNQCSDFIQREHRNVSSTSEAARLVASDENYVNDLALCSLPACLNYELTPYGITNINSRKLERINLGKGESPICHLDNSIPANNREMKNVTDFYIVGNPKKQLLLFKEERNGEKVRTRTQVVNTAQARNSQVIRTHGILVDEIERVAKRKRNFHDGEFEMAVLKQRIGFLENMIQHM